MGSLHLQAGGPQKLTFYSAGRKGMLARTLLKVRLAPCCPQEAGTMAAGSCPPPGPQKISTGHGNAPSAARSCLLCRPRITDVRLTIQKPGAHDTGHPSTSTSVNTSSQPSNTYPRPFFSQFSFPPSSALAPNPRCCTDQDGAREPRGQRRSSE